MPDDVLPASFRETSPKQLPLYRGLLRITGDTLEGPLETDAFDVIPGPEGEVGLVLLDLQTRDAEPSEVAQALLSKATRGLAERTPLHAIMLDLVRGLFEFSGSELRATLLRFSVTDSRFEISTAGMPPAACAHATGTIAVHAAASPPLTSITRVPPPVQVLPLVWGSTWMVVSDGFTSGSDHPDVVHRLAQDLDLCAKGLALSGESPDALYDTLASRVSESGRFARDDATLVLIGADPNARFQSGIRAGVKE